MDDWYNASLGGHQPSVDEGAQQLGDGEVHVECSGEVAIGDALNPAVVAAVVDSFLSSPIPAEKPTPRRQLKH